MFLRYPDGVAVLPECWLWHPDVVEELLWLMHAWRAAYEGRGASVQLAGDWHDRQRPGVDPPRADGRRARAAGSATRPDPAGTTNPAAPPRCPSLDAAAVDRLRGGPRPATTPAPNPPDAPTAGGDWLTGPGLGQRNGANGAHR